MHKKVKETASITKHSKQRVWEKEKEEQNGTQKKTINGEQLHDYR